MSDTHPPLEYLITCSEPGLESFELSRMNQAANLRKQLRQIVERWIESEVDARVARCMLEFRRGPFTDRREPMAEVPNPVLFEQLTIPFLPPGPDSAGVSERQECETFRDVEKVAARPAAMIEIGTWALSELESMAGSQARRLGRLRPKHALRCAGESSSTRIPHGFAQMDLARGGVPPDHVTESMPCPTSAGDSQAHVSRDCAA
jgi:hypothetical protein